MKGKIRFKIALMTIALSAIILSFHSCSSNEGPNSSSDPNASSTLVVANPFNYETMQNVDISIQIQSADSRPNPHVIKIYDHNPGLNGQLITTGMTDASLLYTAVLRIPATMDTVWIENIADSTTTPVFVPVKVVAKKINYSFSMMTPTHNLKAGTAIDPGCSSGCTRTISTKVSSILIEGNEQVCLTTQFNGSVTFNTSNGTGKLILCGADTISNFTVTGMGVPNIIVSNSGKLTLKNTSISKVNITNYGNFIASNGFTVLKDRIFTNYGFAQTDVLTLTNGTVNNYSTLNVTREINNTGTFVNSNLLQVAGVIVNNANSTFSNDCSVSVMGDFQNYGIFSNKGYMGVSGNVQLNLGSKNNLFAQSNLEIASVTPQLKGKLAINGEVSGPLKGSGKITVDGRTDIFSTATFLNQIDLCDADGIENLQITLPSNVTFCNSFIPTTTCTPRSGTPQLRDQDGDGVPDIMDEFPNDPDRAFTSYYPNKGTFASLCFNDVWPSKGDGAYNSFVVDFQYKIITNSRNQVKDIYGTYQPRAEGAALENAFAVALPVPPSGIDAITGIQTFGSAAKNIFAMTPQGYEDGNYNYTVFPVVNSVYNYFNANYSVNVWPQTPYMALPAPVIIHVQLATPLPSSQLMPPYNPFLIHDSKRKYEVHMVDHPPTDLANIKLFGTADDFSDIKNGLYYRTKYNTPWVIEIPVSFDYLATLTPPTDISSAYLKFSEWAQSAGTKSKDWYLNKPGYRNSSKIYNKK